MNKATVYTRPLCPYCVRALTLLQKKGAEVEEISAAFDREKREEMLARSNGRTTYPQIFIGDVHVGGCDELLALERDGKLDGLLNG
ncbi:MAG: glutaredoxin 3 [Parvularculaceae bacterium]